MNQKVCSATRAHTHTKTDTKVDTEDTLSGFKEYFIQLIIKDQSNKKKQWTKKGRHSGLEPSTYIVEHLGRQTG